MSATQDTDDRPGEPHLRVVVATGDATELATIQHRLKILARVGLGLLLFAVVAMSVARYL